MTPTTSSPALDEGTTAGVDAGIYRLIDAVLELDGWTMSLGPTGADYEVALVHRDEPGFVISRFATGGTPGTAALAAIRRFHSITDVERWARDWPIAS